MISNPGDGTIYVALVLSALTAIMSARTSTGAVADKVQWLLTQDGMAEMTVIAGAIGDQTKFPVSP